MSCSYADGLSPYEDKGVVGLAEKFDSEEIVAEKCSKLAEWILQARFVVVHTGAGISTSAGIPDFRGPNGVWTLERKGLKPNINISFDDAKPTCTHLCLKKLVEDGHVKYIITQNIDGLHLKSGLPRKYLSELHGNIFIEQCGTCYRQFVRPSATTSVGQKCLNSPCLSNKVAGRPCRGKLHDNVLDWEDNLPEDDLDLAVFNSCLADLSICLGTTLQIVPSGNLPLRCKKFGGKVAIVNLQPTKHDKKADLIINYYVDDVMKKLMKLLGVELPEYDASADPSALLRANSQPAIEWTIDKEEVKRAKKICDEKIALFKKPPKKRMKKETILKKEEIKEELEDDIRSKLDGNEIKAENVEDEL